MLSPRPMVEFPDLPEQPRNSGYHARLWNRRSGGWASISTDKSEQLRNRRQASSALPSHPSIVLTSPNPLLLIFPQTFTGDRFLNVRHFSGGEAIAEDEHCVFRNTTSPRMDFVELPLTPDNSSLNRESGRLKVDPCRRFFPDTHYVRE